MLNSMLGKKSPQILIAVVIILIFIAIYLLNKLYPLQAEDWVYSFIFTSDQHVNGLSDIVKSQYEHYLFWGGRCVTHSIAQFLLMIDINLAHVLNSLAFVCFIGITYYISNMYNTTNIGLFIAMVVSLWLLLPDIASTTIWITYSANYLWGTLIVISFMAIYCSYYKKRELDESKIKSVLMFFGGIIAGWTNENISLALFFFIFVMILYFKYKKVNVPTWAVYGLIGVFIGILFLILAPGNSLRTNDNAYKVFYENNVRMIKVRLYAVFENYIKYLLIPTLIYISSLILFVWKSTSKRKEEILFISLLFAVSAGVATIVMAGSPYFPSRTLFGVVTFMIIGTGYLLANIKMKNNLVTIPKWVAIIGLLVLCAIDYTDKYNYLRYLDKKWTDREQFILSQKAQNEYDIVLTDDIILHEDFMTSPISGNPEEWQNKAYALFHGVKSVKAIKPKK